jgi:tetratricopeptide (TPR) repeat protein
MKASHDTNADNSAAKQAALDAMNAREWPQALAQGKAHWAANPDAAWTNPDDMHDRAVSHFHCGDKDVALTWLNKAADIQPDYGYRYASRGWMKQACGDLRGAIEDYKRAVELDPEDAVTWNNLGLLEEQLGYQEQAKERYRVSDELLGILKERGIDPETDTPAFRDRPQAPSLTTEPETEEASSKSFWGEIRRAVGTTDGRIELWDFIRNGFTLKG